MRVYVCPLNGGCGKASGRCARKAGVAVPCTYNAAMTQPPSSSRRQLRRTALWAAFAALAGFLLADLI